MRLVKISSGKYRYGDYIITNMGYYPPDRRVVWEATKVEDDGEGVSHGFSLRECLSELKMSLGEQRG